MKKLICILFIWLLWSGRLPAQILPPGLPEQDACNALKICGGTFQSVNSYFGYGSFSEFIPSGPTISVNNFTHERHSVWFELDVATAGDIVFTLNVGPDYYSNYGFSVYDITNTNCSNLSLNDLVRFTAWIGQSASGGLSPGSALTIYSNFTLNGQNYLAPIAAQSGDKYLICVHQYSRPARNGFSLDFTGSTATFMDNGMPSFASVDPSCNYSQKVSVSLTEAIRCSSVAPDGSDFYISPGNHPVDSAWGGLCDLMSYSRSVNIHFANPLPPGAYWLHSKQGTDGNTSESLCGNQQSVPDSISFVVAPYDPLVFKSADHPGCQKTLLVFSHKVRCGSVAADGSDFRVNGPSVVAIERAIPLGCGTANGLTDSVLLLLDQPVSVDGAYTVSAKKGTDGNTVQDSCGQEQLINDQLVFNVSTFRDIVAENDTVLCGSQLFQLHANAPANPPALDSCSVNYLAPPGSPVIVQSEALQIGTPGIPVFTGAVITPFLKSFSDARLQYLYTSAELSDMGLQPGLITRIGWFVTYDRSVPTQFRNFTIKMGCTTQDSFTNDFIPFTETVYSTSSENILNAGWKMFTLQIPFAWLDINNNLVIEVCFDNENADGGSLAEVALVAKVPKSFPVSYLRYGWGLTGCAINNSQGGVLVSEERPVTRIGFKAAIQHGFQYSWVPSIGLTDSSASDPVADITGNITYTVSAADQNGCYLQDTIRIALSPNTGAVTPSDTTLCPGDRIQLIASGGRYFNWLTGDTGISCTQCHDPYVSPAVPSVYTVFITDEYNCTDTAYASVGLHPEVSVTVLPGDTTVKYGSMVQLQAIARNASYYEWTPVKNLANPSGKDPVALITEPGNYIVIARSDYGCTATDTTYIDVDYRDHIYIPDAFSPNNDGLNDIFRPGNLSFQRVTEFRVFNRWGGEVYNSNGGNAGWDGSHKGTRQQTGTYFYIIRIAYPDGYSETYKGDVTLIR